jgi:flagellar biogenesis protein FliO
MRVSACTFPTFLLVVSVFFVFQAVGAETNSTPSLSQDPGNGSVDLLVVFIRTLGALLLIIALFLSGAWFFRRSRFFSLYQSGPAQLRVLESRSLGYRSSVAVVAYSQQRFLVAVSASGVSLLSILPDGTTEENSGAGRSSFAEYLNRFQARKT